MSNFSDRHNGLKQTDINKMLDKIGVNSMDQLIDQTIPPNIRLNKSLDLPEALRTTLPYTLCKELPASVFSEPE